MTFLKNTFALLTCALAATTASAATVQIKFDNPIFTGSGSDNVHITYADTSSATGTTTEHVAAGRFQGTASKLSGVDKSIFVDSVNNVFMYCYDIYQDIKGGDSVKYEINMNATKEQTLVFIGAVNLVLNKDRNNAIYDPYAWLRSVTGEQGAAIQLGIWESKYDTGWDLFTGDFLATKSDLDKGTLGWWEQFKKALPNAKAIDPKYVMVLENGTYQDMITGDPPSNDVPEPGSLALIGAALAGLAMSRRKKSR